LTTVSIEANPRRVCRRKSAPRFLIMWTSWRYLNEQCGDIFHILTGTGESGVLTSNKFWILSLLPFLIIFLSVFLFCFPASVIIFFSYYLCICLYLMFCNLRTFLPANQGQTLFDADSKLCTTKEWKDKSRCILPTPNFSPFFFPFCSFFIVHLLHFTSSSLFHSIYFSLYFLFI
jgi:hypothetical protein